MRSWRARLSDWRRAIFTGIERFPVSLVALAAFVIVVNLDIAEVYSFVPEDMIRLGALCGAAAIVAAAIVLYGERYGVAVPTRHGISLAAAAIVVGAIWYSGPLAISNLALVTASLLALPLAPYLRSGPGGFWLFLWRLVFAGLLAFLAVVIFCAGLSAILASLDYLFGVGVADELYAQVWSIGLGFVGPLFALSLIPPVVPHHDAVDRSSIVITGALVLSDFVAVPLVAAYALILHAYAVKIVVTAEVPRNQIGWMVLSFGLAVLLLRVLVHPFASVGRPPTRVFLRFWAFFLVVPLALLAYAVWLRIEAYGLTPDRYALALFALYVALVLIAQVDERFRHDIRVIPALAAACLLFASVGPWGAIQASAAWQTARLTASLDAVGALDEEGRLAALPKWELAPATDVQSIVWLLRDLGQLRRLQPLFAGRSDDPFAAVTAFDGQYDLADRVAAALNVTTLPYPEDTSGTFSIGGAQAGSVVFEGYDVVVPALYWGAGTRRVVANPPLTLEPTMASLDIVGIGARVSVPAEALRPAIDAKVKAIAENPQQELQPLFIELIRDGRKIGLLFDGGGGRSSPTEFVLNSGRIDLFLRRADWQD